MELILNKGIVTLPCEALVRNLTYEEICAIATFKGAFESAYHDPEGKEEITGKLVERLKDDKLIAALKSLKERGVFDVLTEGGKITLRFDLDKA